MYWECCAAARHSQYTFRNPGGGACRTRRTCHHGGIHLPDGASASNGRPGSNVWDVRVALLLIVVLFGAQTVFTLIAFLILAVQSGGDSTTIESGLQGGPGIVVGVASYLFGAAMVLELTRHLALRRGWPSLRASVSLVKAHAWPIGVVAALVTAVGSDALSIGLGKPIVPPEYRSIFANPTLGAAFGLFTVLVPPFTEEVVFRGVLFPALARRYGTLAGIGGSALAFGFVHLLTYGFDWYVILLTTITGLVLGALRAYTGSLWPSVAAHATNNAYASLEALILPGILGYWP